ncbi:MAG: protoheme IX farnesyltransferase [Nitrospirae bacterium]|nr:protoheme IX farnesyltransferase [Nitrospirota bacterium]
MNKSIRTSLELCKITLSFFSALSAATGFILAGTNSTFQIIFTVAGVFFLACGSCALNQYQERRTDALMDRTKNRPIPSGRMKPLHALFFSLILLLAGFLILGFTGSLPAFLLGGCAVVLYNGVYTYLKRKTAFASVPCAVIGAIPPAIGWFAASGKFPDHHILAVCFLFYIWQITHFWLLFLSHGSDYEKAGLPSLTKLFAGRQLERIVFIWLFATAVATLLTSLYGLFTSRAVNLLLFAVTIWLIWNGVKLVSRKNENTFVYRSAFNKMNTYILFVMSLLSVDRVI